MILTPALFEDNTLQAKHRKYLGRANWSKILGSKRAKFAPAKTGSLNRDVLDGEGKPAPPPHSFFVNDGIHLDVFDIVRLEQASATSIKAIFILLSERDLAKHSDPISWDKMEEMLRWPQSTLCSVFK